MDNGGIPGDWNPMPPPDVGTSRWKDDLATSYVIEKGFFRRNKNLVVKLPIVEDHFLGYMAIRYYPSSGHDYHRVDEITSLL